MVDPNMTLYIHLIPDSRDYTIAPCSKRARFGDYYTADVQSSNGKPTNLIRTVHVNTLLLQPQSLFFHKLFLQLGTSNLEHLTPHINIPESEEPAFMDLLHYAYTLKVSRTTPDALLDLLLLAEKYEFKDCFKCCMRLMLTTTHPLTDLVKHFLVRRFKDISKSEEELLDLPLVGIEAILSSDHIQPESEDEIYDFVMKWARRHYTNQEERQQMLATRLLCLIRFPLLSSLKLIEVLKDTDIRPELLYKLTRAALCYQDGSDDNAMSPVVKRAYKLRPVTVVRFRSPHEECMVFFVLKREECMSLSPSSKIRSQVFRCFGERVFYLLGHCHVDQQSSSQYFGLSLGMQENGSMELMAEVEFAARTKLSPGFESKHRGVYKFKGGTVIGPRNLFDMPLTAFVAEDSPYFSDRDLLIRVVLVKK